MVVKVVNARTKATGTFRVICWVAVRIATSLSMQELRGTLCRSDGTVSRVGVLDEWSERLEKSQERVSKLPVE